MEIPPQPCIVKSYFQVGWANNMQYTRDRYKKTASIKVMHLYPHPVIRIRPDPKVQ